MKTATAKALDLRSRFGFHSTPFTREIRVVVLGARIVQAIARSLKKGTEERTGEAAGATRGSESQRPPAP